MSTGNRAKGCKKVPNDAGIGGYTYEEGAPPRGFSEKITSPELQFVAVLFFPVLAHLRPVEPGKTEAHFPVGNPCVNDFRA